MIPNPFRRVGITLAALAAATSLAACGAPAAAPPTPEGLPATAESLPPATEAVATAAMVADTPEPTGAAGDLATPAAAMPMTRKLNLNTATSAELGAVPGANERMVREFEEYRPYVSIQEFRREMAKYIDEAQIAAYEEHLFVPVNPNEADDATLMQLPGVTATVVEAIKEQRPFASNEAFLAALAGMILPEQVAAAAAYLAP